MFFGTVLPLLCLAILPHQADGGVKGGCVGTLGILHTHAPTRLLHCLVSQALLPLTVTLKKDHLFWARRRQGRPHPDKWSAFLYGSRVVAIEIEKALPVRGSDGECVSIVTSPVSYGALNSSWG